MRYDVLREGNRFHGPGEWLGWVEADSIEQAQELADQVAAEREERVEVTEPACDPAEYDDNDEYV